jgi:hypothetical protein
MIHSSRNDPGRRWLFCFSATLCLAALGACGMPNAPQGRGAVQNDRNAPSGQAAAAQPTPVPSVHPMASPAEGPQGAAADTAWANPASSNAPAGTPLPPPPSSSSSLSAAPLQPIDAASPGAASQAAAKLDVENLDTSARIDRLEAEVADMRANMNMILPALTKMAAAQQDLQQALNKMNGGEARKSEDHKDAARSKFGPTRKAETKEGPAIKLPAPQASANAAPLPLTAASTPAGPPAPAAPVSTPVPTEQPAHAAYSIDEVRFGAHGNMTRMVLDASGRVPYSYALDKSGTLLTVHLPQSAWKTFASQTQGSSPVVQSYAAHADSQGGYSVAVKLKQPVSVSWTDILTPTSDGGYRVVFDLTPKG